MTEDVMLAQVAVYKNGESITLKAFSHHYTLYKFL